MPYSYETEKTKILTMEGQKLLQRIRAKAQTCLETAGCARMQEIIRDNVGDSWLMCACVDFMVEMGELEEIEQRRPVRYQSRIFIEGLGCGS
jgi:hypothetical protein